MASLMNDERTNIKQRILNIDINITQFVFTPFACASIVNEFIKTLVFQKSQIPYPYNWLKTVIDRKKNASEVTDKDNRSVNFNVIRNYRIASTAYNTLEEIMRNIRKEFQSEARVHEVLILFGTTPQCPKEAFTIKIPLIARGHIEDHHMQAVHKNQHKILRDIFLSEIWQSAGESTIAYTNMYVMLKKSGDLRDCEKDAFFLPKTRYNLPTRVKNIIINLIYDKSKNENCCSKLTVFRDDDLCLNSNHEELEIQDSKEDNTTCCSEAEWYQAKELVTGFKDCFINKVSVSELW